MLGTDDVEAMTGWSALEIRVQLPWEEQDYFAKNGLVPTVVDSRRGSVRKYYRVRGILRTQNERMAIYTADASRVGIRFLSPVQLFPAEYVHVTVPNNNEFRLEVTRCRRMGQGCYDCGAVFTSKPLILSK